MKRSVMIAIVLATLGGVALTQFNKPHTEVYTAPQVIEKEVEVDALEEAIKTAQNAKLSEIEASAQQAYDEAYTQEMKKVELQVITDFNSKIDARQVELEKETKQY